MKSSFRRMLANPYFEGSPMPFAHFWLHSCHRWWFSFKIINLTIYTHLALFVERPWQFAHFILIHKMMSHKIMILSYLSKVIFWGKSQALAPFLWKTYENHTWNAKVQGALFGPKSQELAPFLIQDENSGQLRNPGRLYRVYLLIKTLDLGFRV